MVVFPLACLANLCICKYDDNQSMLLLSFKESTLHFSELHLQGILVFASVMATLGLQIILESVRQLLSDVKLCL